MKTNFFNLFCLTVVVLAGSVVTVSANNNNDKKRTTEAAPAKTCMVSGRIIDKDTQEPLAGVAIKVNGSDKCIYTDLDGQYSISGVAAGKCEVKVELISYESKVVLLNPEEDLSIDLSLKR